MEDNKTNLKRVQTCKLCGIQIDHDRLFCDDDCMNEYKRIYVDPKLWPKNMGYGKGGSMVYIK